MPKLLKRLDAGHHYPDYFSWLGEQVCVDGRYTDQSYWRLARELFDIIYIYDHPLDGTRAMDGERLRDYYYDEGGTDGYEGECTVLEVLVALARRIEDVMDELDGENRTSMYFWEMIDNLGLSDFSDFAFEEHPETARSYISHIEDVIAKWMYRNISYNGEGGPFPLKHPREDQRKVELWYQAWAYIDEHY